MIPAFNLKKWLSFINGRRPTKSAPTGARPQVEQLEDRVTPSTLDLTTHGAYGSINSAVFRQFDAQPTGTGVINSFVRIQATKGAEQQGYNSDFRKVQFDENTSPQFTRSLTLDSVPTVISGGVKFREFLLDINQKASQPLLSLDELRVYVSNASNLHDYSTTTHKFGSAPATMVYDMGDNWVKLDARLNQGSGKGDIVVLIPDSAFSGGSYVYLFSKFGTNQPTNGGFEEWAAGSASLANASGSISGSVFDQTNNNTVGVANVLVYIDVNHDNIFDNNDVFTYTDANGHYQFFFLTTGATANYTVTFIPPTDDILPVQTKVVLLDTMGKSVTAVDFFVQFDSIDPPPPGS